MSFDFRFGTIFNTYSANRTSADMLELVFHVLTASPCVVHFFPCYALFKVNAMYGKSRAFCFADITFSAVFFQWCTHFKGHIRQNCTKAHCRAVFFRYKQTTFAYVTKSCKSCGSFVRKVRNISTRRL